MQGGSDTQIVSFLCLLSKQSSWISVVKGWFTQKFNFCHHVILNLYDVMIDFLMQKTKDHLKVFQMRTKLELRWIMTNALSFLLFKTEVCNTVIELIWINILTDASWIMTLLSSVENVTFFILNKLVIELNWIITTLLSCDSCFTAEFELVSSVCIINSVTFLFIIVKFLWNYFYLIKCYKNFVSMLFWKKTFKICPHMKMSYRFGTTRWGANDDRTFIFMWTVPLRWNM